MPIFEVKESGLLPFRQLKATSSEVYEREIEDLLWDGLEEFTGESLFRVARQISLPLGGVADIVALERSGRVVVIEIKRDVDRKQLAQCLEYAGWARRTNLDEISTLYHGGEDAFWTDWQEFTESDTPVVIGKNPRLMLVAREFMERTESATEFLIENGVPLDVIRVSMYRDAANRTLVDIEGDHEPLQLTESESVKLDHTKIQGRRITLGDLLEYGLMDVGDALEWDRPRLGEHYTATVKDSGIALPDGREFASPSKAAVEASHTAAQDGWVTWTLVKNGKKLNQLRHDLQDLLATGQGVSAEDGAPESD